MAVLPEIIHIKEFIEFRKNFSSVHHEPLFSIDYDTDKNVNELEMLVTIITDMFSDVIQKNTSSFTKYYIGGSYIVDVPKSEHHNGLVLCTNKNLLYNVEQLTVRSPTTNYQNIDLLVCSTYSIFDTKQGFTTVYQHLTSIKDYVCGNHHGNLTYTLYSEHDDHTNIKHIVDKYINCIKYCKYIGFDIKPQKQMTKYIDAPVMVLSGDDKLKNIDELTKKNKDEMIKASGGSILTHYGMWRLKHNDDQNIIAKYKYYVLYNVTMFNLQQSIFFIGNIKNIHEHEPNNVLYSDLYFSHKHYNKDIIKQIITNYNAENCVTIGSNKKPSMFIILHGPPGSGKTSTAEAISATLNKPLYHFKLENITPEYVYMASDNDAVETIFSSCERWGAIVFIDEGDIHFTNNKDKNASTICLIKALENYPIPVVMTCNNIDNIDQSLINRSNMIIKYNDIKFDKDGKRFIWSNLLKHNKINNVIIEDVVHYPLNGRDIKNIINLALSIVNSREEITNKLISQIVTSTKDIKTNTTEFYSVMSNINTKFTDIIGSDDVKQDLMQISKYLKFYKIYNDLGGSIPKGLLFCGPPGRGKTLMSKAFAREANATFIYTTASGFNDTFIGVGAKRVRELFAFARDNTPAIIFIDEIDSMSTRNGKFDNTENVRTINALLAEMDGMIENNDIMIIGATNYPDNLDKALLRSGRFDKHIFFDYPDKNNRIKMFELYLQKIKLANIFLEHKEQNIELLAKKTAGFTGADIKNICNQGIFVHMQKLNDYSNFELAPNIDFADGCIIEDFFDAIDNIKAGNKKINTNMSDDEKMITSYHEAGHALVGLLLEKTCLPSRVTIAPRGNSLGLTFFDGNDKKHKFRKEYIASLCISLGGRIAEKIIYDDYTSGAMADLFSVSEIAYNYFTKWNMGTNICSTIDSQYSESYKAQINQKVDILITYCSEIVETLLRDNIDFLHSITKKLFEYETIDGDDLLNLIPSQLLQKYQILNIPV